MTVSGEPRDPDGLLRRAGVTGDARRDQHFLIDDRVLDRLPGYAAESDRSRVLEVGAGTGALTDRLLAVADHVTAIERDRRLVEFLRREFTEAIDSGILDVVHGDALEVDLPQFTVSVSNLPYGVASEILFRLLPRGHPLVAMVQREFAERMVADAGSDDYGRLSITAQHYAGIEIVETVPPTAFEPAPPVESAVVRTRPRPPPYEVRDEDAFLDLVRAVFTQRRKTMRNALRNTTHLSGIEDVAAVIEGADPALLGKRPEMLEPAEFARLAQLIDRGEGA